MRLIKTCLVCCLLGILSLAAEEIPDLTTEPENALSIEADFVNYVGENQYVKASGNVIVVRGEVNLQANDTIVNFREKKVSVSNGFVLNRSQQQIYGTALDYDYVAQEGYGRNVGFSLMGSNIKGKSVLIREDMLIIDEAVQTSCPNEDNPCNRLTAQRMTIYPEWGNVVNDHAVVYIFFLPVMYVPNSVSDLNGGQDEVYSAIPRLGYNPVEGNYIKAGWSFYQNEKFNGTIDLHYLSNLGFRTGFTDNYKLDQANRGQLRVHYLTGLGGRLSYGWKHRLLLGVPYKNRTQIIDDFFRGIMPPSKEEYPELTLELVTREMIGYQWVSYSPKLGLTLPRYELLDTGLKYTVNGYAADILEEDVGVVSRIGDMKFEGGNREYMQYNWETEIYRDFNFADWGLFTPGVLYSDSTYYDQGRLSELWSRLIYYANYRKSWAVVDFKAGYKYTPAERGNSPFNAETFYAGTSEEYNFGLTVPLWGDWKIDYEQYYSVTERKVRDQIYGMAFKLHCWNAKMSWSTYYSQFSLGMSL